MSDVDPDDPHLGDLDLLFYDVPVDGEFEHVKLLDDPYLLVARPGDFPDGQVRMKRLDGRPMVGCHPTCDQPWMERALSDAGARPRIVFRSPGNETILSMVRAGMGSAVLPWLALHGSDAWSDDRLRIHELRPVLARGIYLHWPAGSAQSHWRHGRSRSPSRSQLTLQSSPSRRPQHRSVTPWES